MVGDVKHFGLDLPEEPALYTPYTQINPWKRWMSFAARTQGDAAGAAQALKQEIWKVDSQLPVTKVETMSEVAASSFAARRFNMSLLSLFAGLALVLAAIGIYGVMSNAVTQRTQEIGIRLALGARAIDVLKLIIRNGMTLVIIGVAVGLAGAFALTRLMTTLVVRSNTDRWTDDRRCVSGFDWRCTCWRASSRRAEQRRSIRSWRCATNEGTFRVQALTRVPRKSSLKAEL